MNLRRIIGLTLILPFLIFLTLVSVLGFSLLGIVAFPFVLGMSLYEDGIDSLFSFYENIFAYMFFPLELLKND